MKLTAICLGLALSTVALADSISMNQEGSTVSLIGPIQSTSSEILEVVDEAHSIGFKDHRGQDFFVKTQKRTGSRNLLQLKNKYLTTSLDSAFTVIYKVDFRGNPGDFELAKNKKILMVKGEAARMLMGAVATVNSMDNTRNRPIPVGMARQSTKSGKVVCTKVVAPRAVPSCTIKL